MPKPDTRTTFRFDAIGTAWEIETPDELSVTTRTDIATLTDTFDREYSRFRQDSLVSHLARTGGSAAFTHGGQDIFSLYDTLYDITDGRVTPLIGAVLSELGYDANYSLTPKSPRVPERYDRIVSHAGETVTLATPALLDVGAVGKGCLVDMVAKIVAQQTPDYTVDGSGDIAVGSRPSRIGLEDPADSSRVIGHADIADASICGSAANRRVWGDGLHHIVDPVTLQPVRKVIATWAIAGTTILADGLSTALFFTDPEKLRQAFDCTYVVLYADGSVAHSPDDRITLYD